MTQPAIQFYQLLTMPLEHAVPRLMEKAYGQDMRAVVWGSEVQVRRLDEALWANLPGGFLPHGTDADPHPARQPIYLTPREENPNAASLLVITDGRSAPPSGSGMFTRVFDVFDGTDEMTLQAARQRWKAYKDAGRTLTYIRQKDDGGWEKIMTTAPAAEAPAASKEAASG